MRLLKFLSFIFCIFFLSGSVMSQGIFTGINNTVINLPCSQTCTNLNFQIPHLKSDDNYQVVSIPYTPYPYTTPLGNELTALYADDKYSQAITLPFPICFYGAVYNQVVVGSNGLLTFDVANASCDGAYTVSQTIPFAGGVICSQNSTYYPRAAIMGAYSDLDPQPSASPLGRKIEWRFEGTAPFRRFVASWNRVGVFGNNGCAMISPTTFQIVINESTGAIEVFFERKTCQDGSTGRAILGVQDWNRTNAVAAFGKNATFWTASNEGYRFVPSGTTSRFVSSQLFLPDGVTLVANATTTTTTAGLLDISFGNVCPPGTSQQYIVRTTYSSCLNPTIPIVIDDVITVNRSIGLSATAVTTNTLCGVPSGTIEVTVPPGIGVSPYTFVLDGGTPVVAPSPYTFTNVGQGVHTVVVTDASVNCTSTITNIPVNRTNNLAATLTPSITSCSSVSDGRIAVAPQNGSAPYTFVLNPGGVIQTGATTIFTGLAPNTYTVTVTDASGCSTAALTTQVDAGPAYTTVVTATDARCFATATGSITVTPPASGTAPFQYSLDGINWQASNVFNNLLANSYTVYFREANGCQGSQMSVVNQPPPLSATVAAVPVICNGQNNGTITVTPAGGTAPYQYSIDGGTNWQASNIFNVIANPYTVTIRDNNNCITTQPITVTEPAALTGSYIATNATCNGGNDGTITVTALGGNSVYEYSIDGGTNWQSSNVFNVAPATYTVRVRDNLGCNIQFPATVALTNDLVLTPQIDPTICESKSTQLALISNATKYAWSPAIGLSDTTIFNPVANPTVTTQYTVTATLGRCTATDIVMVNVNAAPIPNAGQDAFICYGQTYTLQGSGGVQFTWTPSTFLNSTSGANPVSNPSKTITYTLAKVVDALGCESLTTDDMVLDVTPPIKVTTFPFDTIGYPGDQFQLQAIAAVPAANIFKWSPATRLSDANSFNPQVTVGNIGDDVLYQVTASTPAGCKGEGFVRIRVYKGPDIYVPTGFTPNGDGKNDRFIPFPVGMKSISYFRVFNRWGQPVYTSAQINQGWDGTINGVPQAAGTYVWMVQGVTKDNKTITKKGVVTLIR